MPQRVQGCRVDLKRPLHQPLRVLEFSALEMRKTEQKKRVEVSGLKPQHVAIQPARLGEVPLLMQLKCRPEQLVAHRPLLSTGI